MLTSTEDFFTIGYGALAVTGARLSLVLIEYFCSKKLDHRNFNWLEIRSTIVIHILIRLFRLGSSMALAGVFVFAYSHRLVDLGEISPLTLFGLYVFSDFVFYWSHRYMHSTRFGWAEHAPHHTSNRLNFTSSLRNGFTNFFTLMWVWTLATVFLGIPPHLAYTFYFANLLYQFWIHSEIIPKLGWLEWILNTPSHHRVHHSNREEHFNCNFGGTFIVWDRLFGTFKAEDDTKLTFGFLEKHELGNVLRISFSGWIPLVKELRRKKSIFVLFESPQG